MNLHSASSAGSIPIFPDHPHQHIIMNGAPSSAPPAWTESHYDCSGLAGSGGGLVASKVKGDIFSPLSMGATPHFPVPDTVTCTSPPTLSAFPPLPPYSPTSAPVSQGPAYQVQEYGPTSPVDSSWQDVLSSAETSERPIAAPRLQQECAEQASSTHTLRSIRTRFGDIYAAYELSADRAGGRWVCQCGSTFVRDSDWERHAVHSLSHNVGGGFDCDICDISFTRSDAMSRHRRRKHGSLNTSAQETEGARG
jgi:hypothetical protein